MTFIYFINKNFIFKLIKNIFLKKSFFYIYFKKLIKKIEFQNNEINNYSFFK